MKLNNKGFAVSIILYSIIAVIILTLLLILVIYTTNIRTKMSLSDHIKEKISGTQTLANKILGDNDVISAIPNTTTVFNESSDRSGLYKSLATNSGKPTYFFRGNVTNNYVQFGKDMNNRDLIWRVVRINEDGTVRLILDESIDSNYYSFYNKSPNPIDRYLRRYYSNTTEMGQSYATQAKYTVDKWYNDNLKGRYSSKIMNGDYFCEQEKVSYSGLPYDGSSVNVPIYTEYIPDFRCATDLNGYGIVNAPVGLLTYDELIFAGGYPNKDNRNFYLYKPFIWFTMTPSDYVWDIDSSGRVGLRLASDTARIRPVINIRANVTASGKGTTGDKYIIE